MNAGFLARGCKHIALTASDSCHADLCRVLVGTFHWQGHVASILSACWRVFIDRKLRGPGFEGQIVPECVDRLRI